MDLFGLRPPYIFVLMSFSHAAMILGNHIIDWHGIPLVDACCCGSTRKRGMSIVTDREAYVYFTYIIIYILYVMISIYIDLNLRSRYHVVTKHSPNASTKEVICFPCNPVKSSSELPKSFRWVRSSNNWIVTDLVHLMNLSLLDS